MNSVPVKKLLPGLLKIYLLLIVSAHFIEPQFISFIKSGNSITSKKDRLTEICSKPALSNVDIFYTFDLPLTAENSKLMINNDKCHLALFLLT